MEQQAACLLTFLPAGRNPSLTSTEKRIMCWFAITGAVHMIIEGRWPLDPCSQLLAWHLIKLACHEQATLF